jgi:hypothetical protein
VNGVSVQALAVELCQMICCQRLLHPIREDQRLFCSHQTKNMTHSLMHRLEFVLQKRMVCWLSSGILSGNQITRITVTRT